TLSNVAMLRLEQGKLDEAEQLADRAIGHQRAALKANARNPVYREFLSNHYAVLADIQVRRGQHARAAETAAELARLRTDNAEDAYDAACILVKCVKAAEQDQKTAEDMRKGLHDRYTDRALGLLREAMKRGYKDIEHMKKDDDLASLRANPDFQKLLAELQG